MKKLIALITALAMFSLVSCSDKTETESSSETPAEIQVETMSLKSADIKMAEDFEEIVCTEKRAGYFLIFGKLKTGGYSGYITDNQFAEKKTFIFEPQENETVRTAALMRFGKAAVMTILDDEAFIYIFDKDGNQENCYNIGDVVSADDYFTEMIYSDDGFYINVFCNTVAFIDNDGKYKGNVNTDGKRICRIVNDSDGNPCMLLSEDMKMTLCRLSNGDVAEKLALGELSDYINAVGAGVGDYSIVVVATGGLYALKESQWVKITDFSDNDFYLHNIFDVDMTAENEFVLNLHKDGATNEMRLLTQRDISEIKQKKIVRLANIVGGNIDPYDDLIKKYNSESDDYKIEIADYSAPVDFDERIKNLKLDIISGKAPDIVIFDSSSDVRSYGANGDIFVDMYPLIDNDNDINRNDFLDGFLEKLEINGKLLQITRSFTVSSFMIKNKFADGLTSWNFDEFEEIYNSRPSDMVLSYDSEHQTKQEILGSIINYAEFYDIEKAECHFDSPEFIRAMKFIKENNIGKREEEVAGTSYGGEDAEALYFRNDEGLLQPVNIFGFSYLRKYQQGYSDEDVTFIGFPSDERVTATAMPSRRYGIMANSENIDGAWDFLKYYLFSEDSFRDSFNMSYFPCIEKYYKEQLEKECNYETYIDNETGEEVQTGGIYSIYTPDSSEPILIDLEPFTSEQAATYDNLVRSALKNGSDGDDEVYHILYEELMPYFEGERSAEEAVEIIQSRVSLYLSETYQ